MDELAQVLRHVDPHSSDPALLVGLESPDDAAVYRLTPDLAIVQTVDFFTPIVDDPDIWGRIVAANALSDIYAMGARPVTALNLIGWPRALSFEILGRVLEGGGAVCAEAGVAIVGGHSVDDPEPKYGLAVTGVVDPNSIITKGGGRPGDNLVLTKPIGTGIISSALKEGVAGPAAVEAAQGSMTRLNKDACDAVLEVGVVALTDVTGFGLLGHLSQMLDGGVDAHIDVASVPLLPDALELAGRGIFPGGSKRNRKAVEGLVVRNAIDDAMFDVLNDAQTSGGLLCVVAEERADDLVAALRQRNVPQVAVIGELVPGHGNISLR